MKFELEVEYKRKSVSFTVIDNNKPENSFLAGSASLNDSNGLFFNISIPVEFQGKGIGSQIFKESFEYLSKKHEIEVIHGAWGDSEEYAHLKTGESLNLTVFNENKGKGMNDVEAALKTPTGKWANSVGFSKVEFTNLFDNRVDVKFHPAD